MIIIYTLLTVATIVYLIFYVITTSTLKENYKYYKPTYEALKNKEYLLDYESDLIMFRPAEKVNKLKTMRANGHIVWDLDDENEIAYFKSSEDIKLLNSHYIHKNFMPYCDFYTLYWHRKIKKQILLSSMSIAESRDYKLKQLLK